LGDKVVSQHSCENDHKDGKYSHTEWIGRFSDAQI
jgi:hypothetical protein